MESGEALTSRIVRLNVSRDGISDRARGDHDSKAKQDAKVDSGPGRHLQMEHDVGRQQSTGEVDNTADDFCN